jgi:hypothetical protein
MLAGHDVQLAARRIESDLDPREVTSGRALHRRSSRGDPLGRWSGLAHRQRCPQANRQRRCNDG